MVLKAINKDKYFLSTVIISLMVAVLIHFPESVSLFDRFESHSLFPGMKFMDVANEILLRGEKRCVSKFGRSENI